MSMDVSMMFVYACACVYIYVCVCVYVRIFNQGGLHVIWSRNIHEFVHNSRGEPSNY